MQDSRLQDKNYRLSNFYKITDQDGKLVTFAPNAVQEHFKNNRHNKNIILKSRRLGFTTFAGIDMLDETLFNKFFFSLFISYDEASSKKVFSKLIKFAWDNFPLKHLYQVDTSSANALKLMFGETAYSLIEVKTSGRGDQTSYIHVSEFGKICAKFPEKATEIISGTFPSLIPSGRLVVESTADGETGYFADMFWNAWDNSHTNLQSHEFKAFFYNWQWDLWKINRIIVPDPTIPKQFKEYQQKHNELSKTNSNYKPINDLQLTYWYHRYIELERRWDLLLENYPTTPEEAFVSSGRKMFDQAIIQQYVAKASDPIQTSGDWKIFENMNPSHQYVIGADVAEGVGGDDSAAAILDITPLIPKVVATYKSNEIAPDIFAYELKSKGVLYNTALIAPEINLQGYATVTKLKDIYPSDRIYTQVNENFTEDMQTEKLGWSTNKVTKPKMLYDLASALSESSIVIPSKEILTEMRLFDKNDVQHRSQSSETSKHYDLLMALAIAFQAREQALTNTQDIRTISFDSQTSSSPFSGI